MTRVSYFFITLITLALLGATSCIDDSFATSSTDLLKFSTDTVAFDTVITLQGTATKQFLVYNRGKKQLNISSISMAGEGSGHFYLNVDGQKGTEFHNIEVRGGDSIFVFVESYMDEAQQDAPLEVTDRILFETNGVTQHVTVTAWAQDVIRMSGDTLWTDTHFTATKPYLIYDTLLVAPNVTLTMDPGTTLLFHKGGALRCYGTIKAIGTMDQHITWRGDRLDHVVGEIGFDIMSGQWGGVIFGPGSVGNDLAFVDMRGSELGMHVSSESPNQRALHLLNCLLHNSSSSVLTTYNAWIEAEGTEFSNAALGVVNFIGGQLRIANCTFTNYYLFAAPSDPIVNFLTAVDDNGNTVLDAPTGYVDNCILYGMSQEINIGDLEGTGLYLRNCLMKLSGSDDAHFIDMTWKADPKFYVNRDDYIFDFRLKNESEAIARGNRSYCPTRARYDRYGVDRWSRDGIDIGAYTWVPAAEVP
ncbi:MAG: hypothetical protein IJ160_09405 [Muribaculaceae bacterium]|nr:hypothetical protein [Muribaculaceae bacterium]